MSSRRVKLHNDDNPSEADERCIDDQLRYMVDLLPKKQEISLVEKNYEHDQILKMTLQAIRSVYVRRKMKDDCNQDSSSLDPYELIIDQLPKSHPIRSIVLLDKLSGVLSIAFEVRKKSIDSGSIDQEAIILAEEYLSSFKRDDPLTTDTTLFVDAKISKKMELGKSLKVLIVLSLRSNTHNTFHSRCTRHGKQNVHTDQVGLNRLQKAMGVVFE